MFVNVEDIHDGLQEVELPRLDLAGDGSVTQMMKLRRGYAIIQPLKMEGEVGESGLFAAKQDGIPTMFALVLAVSPYNVPQGGDAAINADIPAPGDIIVKSPYAAEPLDSPSLGTGAMLEGLAPMERSTRGLGIINLKDVQAILGSSA